MSINLPNSFLPSLVAELKTPNVFGISMSGSFSRGQGTAFSDIDLQLYVTEKPSDLIGPLTLRLWQGFLVSIYYGNLEEEWDKLVKPWSAIWSVPGLRQSVILYDPDGTLARLKQAASEFDWSPLQPLADQFASAVICTCAEEVYKILSGLSTENESKILYAIAGLVSKMADAVVVQRGLMIETENRYYDLVQESAGRDSEWTHLFRLALPADRDSANTPAFQTRGAAALGLYRETARMMNGILLDEHRAVIASTLDRIKSTGY